MIILTYSSTLNRNEQNTLDVNRQFQDVQIHSATIDASKEGNAKPPLRQIQSANATAGDYSLSSNISSKKQVSRKMATKKQESISSKGSKGARNQNLQRPVIEVDTFNDNYQTQERPGKFNDNQIKNFNDAIAINSSSMVNDNTRDPLELALREHKSFKDKMLKQKKNLNKSIKQKERTELHQKELIAQYQRDKHRQRNANLGNRNTTSRRVSRKFELASTDSKSKLPYGLRKPMEDMTSNHTFEAENQTKDYSAFNTLESGARTERPQKANVKPKTKIVDKLKKIVPTTADELKSIIENDHKRHSSRFASMKDQEQLTNRLLSQKDKSETHKNFLRVAQECQSSLENLKSSNFSRKQSFQESVKSKPVNSQSFYNKNIEFERSKHQRLVSEARNLMEKESSTLTNPMISSKSRKLANSMERQGQIHERLHNEGKKKLIRQAQDVMDDLHKDTSLERSGSCHRKGIMNLLTEENKNLTFKPEIQVKSKRLSRDRKIEERLLEDAQKRKLRQSHREKVISQFNLSNVSIRLRCIRLGNQIS